MPVSRSPHSGRFQHIGGIFIVIMKKNKAGEKEIAFGAVGSAQEAALQRHLSKALSRCKM